MKIRMGLTLEGKESCVEFSPGEMVRERWGGGGGFDDRKEKGTEMSRRHED